MRITSLAILGFLFTLLVLSDSIMNTQQAVVTMIANEDGLGDTIAIEQELFDAAATRNKKLGARKVMAGFELKKEMAKDAGPHGETSKISGANHSIGKCVEEEKGKLNAKSKLKITSLLPHMKANMVDFLAFSADYHPPKRHPPKNN